MGYRILVAEDDRGLNQGIRLALQKEDVIFDAAYTLEEARRLWREEKPDMVLLDVNFPDGSGFDFLRQLRASSAIPVLMITANDMETDEVTGLTLGADDYITKPFSLMALRARVENIRKRTERPDTKVYEEAGYRFDFEKLEFYVAQLDKKQAEVIRKYYFEEKTWPELQKEMHASSRTLVKRRDDGLTALMAMGQYMEGVMKEQVRI